MPPAQPHGKIETDLIFYFDAVQKIIICGCLKSPLFPNNLTILIHIVRIHYAAVVDSLNPFHRLML